MRNKEDAEPRFILPKTPQSVVMEEKKQEPEQKKDEAQTEKPIQSETNPEEKKQEMAANPIFSPTAQEIKKEIPEVLPQPELKPEGLASVNPVKEEEKKEAQLMESLDDIIKVMNPHLQANPNSMSAQPEPEIAPEIPKKEKEIDVNVQEIQIQPSISEERKIPPQVENVIEH
jgi:hypothetical protein